MPAKKVVTKVKKKPVRKLPKSTEGLPKPWEFKEYKPSKFQPGTTVWQLRLDSMGQKRMFTDPMEMLLEFEKYVAWCFEFPIMIAKLTSSEGIPVIENVPTRRPITVSAFCVIIGCNEDYLRNFRGDVRKNPKLSSFGPVIDAIYRYVEDALKEGALVGQFNANLVSRMLGLAERTDVTTNGKDIGMPVFNIVANAPIFARSEKDVDTKRLS